MAGHFIASGTALAMAENTYLNDLLSPARMF